MNLLALQLPIARDMLARAYTSLSLLTLGSLIVLISWVILLRQLIVIAHGRKSPQQYMVWSFLIPVLNLLWIPWALIASNGYIKKAQLKFIHVDTLLPGLGVQILAIPILVLYLFWGVIVLAFYDGMAANLSHYETVLYLGIILISLFIVFGFYLAYLGMFVHKIKSSRQARPSRPNHSPK